MTDIRMRAAMRQQCRQIAELYSISSDGVADYIWTQLAQPGEAILEVGKRRYEREQSVFSYRNCTVAMLDKQLVGMLVAFPMHVDPSFEETDPVLAPYSKLEEDGSFYVCGVAVYPEFRGQGIGKRFMALSEQQARDRNLRKVSLIVFEQNEGATRLYKALGYEEVAREPVVPHPLIHHTGDALLLVKTLS